MKKYIYIVVALLVATFASCQSEYTEISSTYKNDANAVHFSASIETPQTRVNTMGNGDTWENGDVIKVCNISDNAIEIKKEAVYQYKNNNWELIGSNYIVWADGNENGENTFKAFYPYDEGKNNLRYQKAYGLSFDLPLNQSSNNSTDDNYIGKADLMMATAKVAKTIEPVNLQFSHLLSKVTVNIIKYNDQYEDTKPSFDKSYFYRNSDSQTYGEYRVFIDEIAIHPFIASKENGLQSFTVILSPCKYKNSDKFLILNTEDNNKLTVYASGILTTDGLEAGKAYNFDLVVGKNVVSIEKVTVTPWISNDWDNQEGIADEAYTFKVDAKDNRKITLTSLEEGFTSKIDEKTKQNIKKYSKICLQGPVNSNDVSALLNWIDGPVTIDLSNTTLKYLRYNIFPMREVSVELVIPRDIIDINPNFLATSFGSITLDLTKFTTRLPMLGSSFNINDAIPTDYQRRIVVKIPSSLKSWVDDCKWNATATQNGVSYKIEYVD